VTDPTLQSPAFSEKDFYLQEFRGRTLAVAVQASDLRTPAPLAAVVAELVSYGARVCVLSTERAHLEALLGGRVLSAATPRLAAVAVSRESMPASTPSRAAASATVRAIGPAVSWL